MLARTEPSQAMARNEIVQRVAERTRNKPADSGNDAPRRTEAFEDPDRGFGAKECFTFFHEDIGFVTDWIEAEVRIEGGPQRGLRGEQPKMAGAIGPQHEPREPGAQHALTVENDDRPVVGETGNGLIDL